MFNIFNTKIKDINTIQDFHKTIKRLRKLKIPTPITEEFEGKNDPKFVRKTWYTYQGKHWDGCQGLQISDTIYAQIRYIFKIVFNGKLIG